MRTRLLIALAVVGGLSVGSVGAVQDAGASVTTGHHYRLHPKHNIEPPTSTLYRVCRGKAVRPRCENVLIKALDHARAVMHEPRYHLPASFRSLSGRDQLLVISNLDRRLYGRAPIRGLNRTLDASAKRGVHRDGDPSFVYRLHGNDLRGGGSNWAGGTVPMNSSLFAYYEWMYDDGPGSGNLDCRHRGDPGCWGHRDNVLFQGGPGNQVLLGIGSGTDSRGYFGWTQLFESFDGSATIPCLPTLVGLSRHTIPVRGARLVVHGFGFVHVSRVTVLGTRAVIVEHTPSKLVVRAPRHSRGSGYVEVSTTGGTSSATRASAVRYGS